MTSNRSLPAVTEGVLWVVLPWWATQFVGYPSRGLSSLPPLLHGFGLFVWLLALRPECGRT